MARIAVAGRQDYDPLITVKVDASSVMPNFPNSRQGLLDFRKRRMKYLKRHVPEGSGCLMKLAPEEIDIEKQYARMDDAVCKAQENEVPEDQTIIKQDIEDVAVEQKNQDQATSENTPPADSASKREDTDGEEDKASHTAPAGKGEVSETQTPEETSAPHREDTVGEVGEASVTAPGR